MWASMKLFITMVALSLLSASCSPVRWVKLQDYLFVESAAANARYDAMRGDGKSLVYFPVQTQEGHLSIQVVDLSNTSSNATVEVVNSADLNYGSGQLTVYGSELTETGILLLCILNKNTILGLDMNSLKIVLEIPGIAAPNDIAASPTDPNVFFVAGGTGLYVDQQNVSDSLIAAIPTIGVIYKIDISDQSVTSVPTAVPLNALAGIVGVPDGQLLVSQLYNVVSLPLNNTDSVSGDAVLVPSREVYSCAGSSLWDDCYLADNLIYSADSSTLVIALYRKTSQSVAAVLAGSYAIPTFMWFVGKCASVVLDFLTGYAPAFADSGLHRWFHSMDSFADVHFMLVDVNTGEQRRIRLDSSVLQPPDGTSFDGHVTHVHRHAGHIVLVNFLSSWVMVLEERALLEGRLHGTSLRGRRQDNSRTNRWW
jgi:hypothetical protein